MSLCRAFIDFEDFAIVLELPCQSTPQINLSCQFTTAVFVVKFHNRFAPHSHGGDGNLKLLVLQWKETQQLVVKRSTRATTPPPQLQERASGGEWSL